MCGNQKRSPPAAKADLQGKPMRLKSCPPKTDALTISKRREIPHSADNVRNDNVRFFPQAVKSCPAEVQEFSRRLLTTPLRSIVRSGLSSFRGGPLTACRTAFAGAGFSKPRERVGRGGGGTLATQCAERGIGAFAGRFGRNVLFDEREDSAFLPGGGGRLTPARRALERPIAMACFVDLAP